MMSNQKRNFLIKLIENRFDKGSCRSWQNRDFEELAFQIRHATKIRLSVATLKRFFGKVNVSSDYKPQNSTIEALEEYAHFEEHYKLHRANKKKLTKWGIGTLTGFFIVAMVLWFGISPNKRKAPQEAIISLEKIEGKCPSTAYFEVGITGSTDETIIDFGDQSTPIGISSKMNKIEHFYDFPGYFRPSVKHKAHIISKPLEVLIETNDWQAFANYYDNADKRFYPIPFSPTNESELFHITPKRLKSLGLDTTAIVVVRLANYKKTTTSADAFEYKTRIKNDVFWPGVRCYSSIITIEGTAGKVEFKLVGEGCSGFSQAILKDEHLAIEPTSLVINPNEWSSIEINNNGQNLTLSVNDEPRFSKNYKSSLGTLIGTSIVFHGSGSVEHISLKSKGIMQFKFLETNQSETLQ
ncbi:MAG: hypothetical protein JXR10_13255 [Cyclobacteriaceae bacterium]